MLDYFRPLAAIGRGALVLLLICSFALATWADTLTAPVATSMSATTFGPSTRITINGSQPLPYSVSRPDPQTILIELPGVDATHLSRAYGISSPLIAGVNVELGQQSNNKPIARLRITLRAPVRERSQMADKNLVLELSPAAANGSAQQFNAPQLSAHASRTETPKTIAQPKNAGQPTNVSNSVFEDSRADLQAPAPTPAPRPTGSTVQIGPAQSSATQSSQGAQYGTAGFVGEPINLNVVNADIRDILNYITEQYGVNFVIDSSVKEVPVTVNVNDVPWNIALDSILRANRLGVQVNGNILRVATIEVLATEAAAQEKIRDAQLSNSPLVTEFIRLNYARANGTLAQAAGSTAAFAGGSTNTSYSGGAGGDATGGGGDQGIMPIIKRRLSRRGAIEVDGRSNTLIVTDVRENIDAIRQLVLILDQPEPQVEIETRIVIASRNFSRDLGAQLSAGVISLGRGGLGSVSTLPSSGTTSGGSGGSSGGGATSGPNPFGVPGGLGGTAQPTDVLRAAGANTVIGLTTGLIGTAQISMLITAAESKGQAKTIATPRVTALNNRPAQIESGQQIPVQTTQAAGGTAVVTTTFVSVPLRLSITPQITDVGTVVLRVTVENNSLNTGIAVAGVPGINTQRMQSEVLVPDGGTTVMGGVLLDSEGETQQRTPGVASIPVLGNLFKRKLTTRATDEILFFITPRIYRPDFQGNRTQGTVTDRTRTTTITQPVPLGNPDTNTPTPTQLQQQQTRPEVVVPNSNNPGDQLLNTSPNVPVGTPSAPTARPGALSGQRPQ